MRFTTKISIPVLTFLLFQTGDCMFGRLSNVMQAAKVAETRGASKVEVSQVMKAVASGRSCNEALQQILMNQAPQPVAQSRMDAETARLKKEAEHRRQQEEARARQEAEQRRQEEEARARKEEELNRRREEIRAQQEAEVQLRMQELKDLGGDTSILSRFETGSGNPEEIREYKAALNRADAEIVRLRKESDLNKQNMIDQLTEEVESQKEENRELRSMIEQLMEEVKNLKMRK